MVYANPGYDPALPKHAKGFYIFLNPENQPDRVWITHAAVKRKKGDVEPIVIYLAIAAPIGRVFQALIKPGDLLRWHHAGNWTTPYAEIDGRAGGSLKIGYADAAGTPQFDLTGEIVELERPTHFAYRMDDLRLVHYRLQESPEGTLIQFEADPEATHSADQQVEGWRDHLVKLKEMLEKESTK